MTISIEDAGPFQCRWIEGDDDQCCGAHTLRGSWCDYHRAIVFKPLHGGAGAEHPHFAALIRKRHKPAVVTLAEECV